MRLFCSRVGCVMEVLVALYRNIKENTQVENVLVDESSTVFQDRDNVFLKSMTGER